MPRRSPSRTETQPEEQTPEIAQTPDDAATFADSIRPRRRARREPESSRLIDETRTSRVFTGERCLVSGCGSPLFRDGDNFACERGHRFAGESDSPYRPEFEAGTICPECGGREYWTLSGIVCTGDGCGGRGEPSGIPVPECEPESRRTPDLPSSGERGVADEFAADIEKPTARLSPGFERIVDRVFRLDLEIAYEALERELSLKGRASQADRATIADALDRSQDNARDAHRLYAIARVELEAFELDARAILADMRTQATAALEDEQTARKKAKEGAKRITEADVEDWCAAYFRDEWRDLQIRRKRAEKAVENLERLAELWKTRPKTLEALLASARV